MAGTNDFKSLATGVGANVLTQAEYEALASLLANGFTSGVADSKTINKVLRQSSFVAEAIAKIIADNNVNALDDGDVATFKANLLAAILGSATTPPQFDNDTSLATTAFVQRALGSLAGASQISTPTTFSAATHCGKQVILNAASQTHTLPPANTFPVGGMMQIIAGNSANTIQVSGSDVINFSGTTASSLVLNLGDSINLISLGGVTWLAASGSHQLKYSALFGSSLAANGYQKLPSGLIIQWGSGTTSAAGVAAVAYPITFPTGTLQSFVSDRSSSAASGSNDIVSCDDGTASGMNVYSISDAGVAKTTNFKWLAIGY